MKGIRRHGTGWQARVFVAGMPRAAQPFPIDTPVEEMQAWRRETKARLELQRSESVIIGRLPAGTFAADAERYLKSVTALRDFDGRVYDIERWVEAFGTRRTVSIKASDIRAQRDRWLTVGPKRIYNRRTREWEPKPMPLAASTVNHRLRALENFYTVLFPQSYNPVRDVPEAVEPDAEDRSVPYDVIAAVLDIMPDRGTASRGHKRPSVSKSKARLRLMAYTGLTNSQVAALTPSDIDMVLPAVRTSRRQKGKGAKGGWKPVPADAIPALRAFVDAHAFGPFSPDSLRQSWRRACREFFGPQYPRIRPYDLRHSYATRVLESTHDLQATQRLLSHGDPRTTERYAQHAIPAWLAGAAGKVRLAHSSGPIADGQPRKSLEKRGRLRSARR